MYITNANPSAEQKKLMEKLGFKQHETTDNDSFVYWGVTAAKNSIDCIEVAIRLYNDQIPSPDVVIKALAGAAYSKGRNDNLQSIQKVLGISNCNERCVDI